jgi:hypothetical protein
MARRRFSVRDIDEILVYWHQTGSIQATATRLGAGHAHGALAPTLPVVSHYESSEGSAGNRAASLSQQLLDAGQQQPVAS